MTTYQQYYEILGLDSPPEDRKAVKRAYSKMLKVTRPEDDLDGFMRLRDAHDTALNIIAHQAENAKWEARQTAFQTSLEPNIEQPDESAVSAEPSLTYEDMLPTENRQVEPVSETSYAIGPTPNLDAPVTYQEMVEPKGPPLLEELNQLLQDPEHYNDREKWNVLFRKARKLDIDDYVDFEHLLLEEILHFHGYYDHDNPHYDTPEKLYQKLSPSIAASLFKTMNWDKVNKQGYQRGHQVEWLERRMNLRKRSAEAAPIPQANSGGNGNIWMWIIGAFVILKIIQALGNI